MKTHETRAKLADGRDAKRWWKGSLRDHELRQALTQAVEHDCEHTAEMIALIAEYDARRLFRAEGCASMFVYCVEALGMSNDVAAKRIRVARAARRFPVLFAMLADGRMHVSGVALLATHLTPANANELLAAAAGMTRARIEHLLAQRFPQPDLPALLVTIAASVPTCAHEAARTLPAPGPVSFEPLALTGEAAETTPMTSRAELATAIAAMPAYPRVSPRAPDRHALQVMLDDETRALLEQAQDLLAPNIARSDLAAALKRCLQLAVAELEKRRYAITAKPRQTTPAASPNPRHIPAAVKRAVRARDHGQCTFEANGRRCESRHALHFDHVIPIARGGRSTPENLRLLCAAHNQLQAERQLGEGFMRAKREQREQCKHDGHDCHDGHHEHEAQRAQQAAPDQRASPQPQHPRAASPGGLSREAPCACR